MELKGKLIHCTGFSSCQELKDFGYVDEHWGEDYFRNIFLKDFNLDYILDLAKEYKVHFHIATHSIATDTCEEKAQITGLPLERVIKGVYFEDSLTERIYALAIPGIKNRVDLRLKVAAYLGINQEEVLKYNRIKKARSEFLPMGIKYGTVHPWVNNEAFMPEGRLEFIFFDEAYLEKRKSEEGSDDFSFTIHPSNGYDNHKVSLQTKYWHAFLILRNRFLDRVKAIELI